MSFPFPSPEEDTWTVQKVLPQSIGKAFTSAQGWGTFAQKRDGKGQTEIIDLKWGRLALKTLAFDIPEDKTVSNVAVRIGDREVSRSYEVEDNRVRITLDSQLVLEESDQLTVDLN